MVPSITDQLSLYWNYLSRVSGGFGGLQLTWVTLTPNHSWAKQHEWRNPASPQSLFRKARREGSGGSSFVWASFERLPNIPNSSHIHTNMRAKTYFPPPTHTQSSLLAHTCPHPNTLSKHTHTCPDNSCFSVAHSHRQTMPSPPLPCPLLHFSSHQLRSSPFLLCCGSSDRGIPSLLMLPMGWCAQMKTMYPNGSAKLPQFPANTGGVHVEVRLHQFRPTTRCSHSRRSAVQVALERSPLPPKSLSYHHPPFSSTKPLL